MQEVSKELEEKWLQALLSPPDPSEVPSQAELEEALDFELAKDAAGMDVELVAYCAQQLCERYDCGARAGEHALRFVQRRTAVHTVRRTRTVAAGSTGVRARNPSGSSHTSKPTT